MRIVIDTNILVSAVIANGKPEKVILFVAENNDFQWIVSDYILSEYKEVLGRRKFKLSEEQKHKWFNILDNLTVLIEVNYNINFPRDKNDEPFLACAQSASADYLITGDQDFSDAQKLIETEIISVVDFLEEMDIN